VTNRATGPRSYQVQLHRTSDAYNRLNDFGEGRAIFVQLLSGRV
jgi:hypothetical protein